MKTLIHGSNADCPMVSSGKWKRCEGHEVPDDTQLTSRELTIVMNAMLLMNDILGGNIARATEAVTAFRLGCLLGSASREEFTSAAKKLLGQSVELDLKSLQTQSNDNAVWYRCSRCGLKTDSMRSLAEHIRVEHPQADGFGKNLGESSASNAS